MAKRPENAIGLARREDFDIPVKDERESLDIGDRAVLVFIFKKGIEEELTFEVEHINDDGTYMGRLVEEPTVIALGLVEGDVMCFEPDNVVNIGLQSGVEVVFGAP